MARGRDATQGLVVLPVRQPGRLAMTREGYYCMRMAKRFICSVTASQEIYKVTVVFYGVYWAAFIVFLYFNQFL